MIDYNIACNVGFSKQWPYGSKPISVHSVRCLKNQCIIIDALAFTLEAPYGSYLAVKLHFDWTILNAKFIAPKYLKLVSPSRLDIITRNADGLPLAFLAQWQSVGLVIN